MNPNFVETNWHPFRQPFHRQRYPRFHLLFSHPLANNFAVNLAAIDAQLDALDVLPFKELFLVEDQAFSQYAGPILGSDYTGACFSLGQLYRFYGHKIDQVIARDATQISAPGGMEMIACSFMPLKQRLIDSADTSQRDQALLAFATTANRALNAVIPNLTSPKPTLLDQVRFVLRPDLRSTHDIQFVRYNPVALQPQF